MAEAKVVAFGADSASERARALFQAAAQAGADVTQTTLADANETMLRLREAADLPTLAPGLPDLFRRLADRMEADLLTARAIMERP